MRILRWNYSGFGPIQRKLLGLAAAAFYTHGVRSPGQHFYTENSIQFHDTFYNDTEISALHKQ